MQFKRKKALYLQVAERLRQEVLPSAEAGNCLPPDRELGRRWGVSMRTVREALLVLEAEGRVQRQQGRGTVVQRPRLPVALFSNLNLLDAQSPRFFGLALNTVRDRLEADGHSTRLYTGRNREGDGETGQAFSCPELLDDAEAGRLAGIVALTSELDAPRLQRLRGAGMPMVYASGASPLSQTFSVERLPFPAVRYLAESGRRRIAMIGWCPPDADGRCRLTSAFADALAEQGLPYMPEWCRVEMSFAGDGAGWEAYREIWSASPEKPDALLVADENYLQEVTMAILETGLRVPGDLLLISHQTRHVPSSPPIPIARIEEDVDAFGNLLADQALAALAGRPVPPVPAGLQPFRLRPLQGRAAEQAARRPIATRNSAREST